MSGGQRETTSYRGNVSGHCAVSGRFGCGRISDDKVCGALAVRGAAGLFFISKSSSRIRLMAFDCDLAVVANNCVKYLEREACDSSEDRARFSNAVTGIYTSQRDVRSGRAWIESIA